MITLTIKEVADIKGCTRQYIQKLVNNGTFQAVTIKNSRNQNIHAIPIEQLSEEDKKNYYKQRGIIQTDKTVEYVSQLEEMTANEREECAFWERIFQDVPVSFL